MPYDSPRNVTYTYAVDFDTTEASSLKGPAGKTGKLIDIIVSATETFTATTTAAFIEVGVSAGSAEYASFALGTLADTDTLTATETSGAIVLAALPADTQIELTFNAPTGGTPAGIGAVQIVVDWY